MRLKYIINSLIYTFGIFAFFLVFFLGFAGKAEAHPYKPWNWAPPPSGDCVTSAPWTGYWMYANTSSSLISLPYGTSSTTFSIIAENKVCPGAPYNEAYNVYFNIWNINGNISGLGNYNMGTVGKGPGGVFASWPNISQPRSITVNTSSIKNSPGNHQFCFNWQGHGDYGPGKNDHRTTAVQTFCIDIYIQPQPQGTLSIIKYPQNGANNTHLDGCRVFIFAKINCTGDGGSKSVTVNAGNYDVEGFPDAGYKVTRIRINRYGGGCSPCESNYYNQNRVSSIPVTAGGTTYVDIFLNQKKAHSLSLNIQKGVLQTPILQQTEEILRTLTFLL